MRALPLGCLCMKFEFHGRCFRIALEIFWPAEEPVFRRYRIALREATLRRKLLRSVRDRLKE